MTSALSFVVASIVALTVAPAVPAVATSSIDLTPGPVRLVLPRPPDGFDYEDTATSGHVSVLFWGTSYDQASAITHDGAITWFGTIGKSGKVRFPTSSQTWPPIEIVTGLSSIPTARITGLTGTISSSGAISLKGVFRAQVQAGGTCEVTAPLTLTTKTQAMQRLSGSAVNPRTGVFALASKTLTVTKSGACTLVPDTLPGIYLKGRVELPNGPRIPDRLKRLDIYTQTVRAQSVAPGGFKNVVYRIWTSKAGTVSVKVTCTPTGPPKGTEPVFCETRTESGNGISVRFTGVDRVTVSVAAVATPKPDQANRWLKGSATLSFPVSYGVG